MPRRRPESQLSLAPSRRDSRDVHPCCGPHRPQRTSRRTTKDKKNNQGQEEQERAGQAGTEAAASKRESELTTLRGLPVDRLAGITAGGELTVVGSKTDITGVSRVGRLCDLHFKVVG